MFQHLLTMVLFTTSTLLLPARPTCGQAGQASSEQQLQRLIRQLGAPRFEDRERSEQQLQAMGSIAYELLREHRRDPDIEIRVRACRLVARLQDDFLLEDVDPALKQYLTNYSSDSPQLREAKIALLASLLPQQSIRELARVARYEDSDRLSKTAALAIIRGTYPVAGLDRPELANSIREGVGISTRQATRWLSAYADLLEPTSRKMAASWEKWLAEEDKKLELESDETTSRQVVATMKRLLGDFYHLEGDLEKSRAARLKVSQSLSENSQSVKEWAEWLLERSAWEAVVDLADLQKENLRTNPKLLYALAESSLRLGRDDAQIEQLLDQALKAAAPDNDREHYGSAIFLEDNRGLFEWAEREYRYLIDNAERSSLFRTNAYFRLAGVYYNQQQHAKAAEAFQQLLDEVKSSEEVAATLVEGLGSSVATAKCQRHYYLALDAEMRGDKTTQREELLKAVDVDPEQADVLIAMYRLKDADADWKSKARELVRASAERLQREIAGLRRQEEVNDMLDPQDNGRSLSGALNNYAWLISNTEGDFEEALRFSQQSLHLSPGDAGLLDTLARCYYCLGELDKAIKYQRWAVQRDPHEMQVRRQLELFEAELAAGQPPQPVPDSASPRSE